MNMNPFAQQIQEATEVLKDMTVVQSGGQSKLWEEGFALVRLTEYVEVGAIAQEFNGQVKAPAPHFYLGFMMFDEQHRYDDGTPGKISTFDLSMSTNEKAKAFKLFKRMNYKGTAKSFAQMLGQVFLVQIKHYKGKAADAKVRAILDLDTFTAPIDPMSKQPYPCEEAPAEAYKLFLWDKPTKEQWDSLYIDGTKDDGTSKNWLQDKLTKATNFPGSALENLLYGQGITIAQAPAVHVVPEAPKAMPKVPTMPSASTAMPAPDVEIPW